MVCIFMFHVQQHFPGDLAKPALAESQRGSCSSPSIALPPTSESSCAFVSEGGQGVVLLIGEGLLGDPKGVDGQDRATLAGAYQPAQLSCRERSLCVQGSCSSGCIVWAFPLPEHPCRSRAAAPAPQRPPHHRKAPGLLSHHPALSYLVGDEAWDHTHQPKQPLFPIVSRTTFSPSVLPPEPVPAQLLCQCTLVTPLLRQPSTADRVGFPVPARPRRPGSEHWGIAAIGICVLRCPPPPSSLRPQPLWHLIMSFGFADSGLCISKMGCDSSCFSNLRGLLFGEHGCNVGVLGKGLKEGGPVASRKQLHGGVSLLGFQS